MVFCSQIDKGIGSRWFLWLYLMRISLSYESSKVYQSGYSSMEAIIVLLFLSPCRSMTDTHKL